MLEVELGQPLPDLDRPSQEGLSYRPFQVLVRIHTIPLGVVTLMVDHDGLSGAGLANVIWTSLHEEINVHLRADKLQEVIELDGNGLPESDPLCCRTRSELLDNAPEITVIVCTRDRPQPLKRCMNSLFALQYPNYEILIIDNASQTTAVAEYVNQLDKKRKVHYIREDRPGLAWARNRGLYHAGGEIIAYIDDDEIADPYWLRELIVGFNAVDNVICVTGTALPAEIETQAQTFFEQFGGINKGRGFRQEIFNLTTHPVDNPYYPVPAYGAGGNMAFNAEALRELGGFEPALGSGTHSRGGEDTAAFAKVISSDRTLVFQPTAIVRHYHYRTMDGLSKQLFGYGVGCTAYVLWCLFEDPRIITYFIGMVPQALKYLFSPSSPRVRQMGSDYPRSLTIQQLKGMLIGPFAFLRSRKHIQRIISEFGPQESAARK
jgi:cellulose synthase/poly-beta-1,6-N-acetylglucosamine synthase-like glycosyltransferase